MENITISEGVGWLFAAFAALITLDKIIDLLAKYGKKANAHNAGQDAEITQLRNEVADIQKHLAQHDSLLDADNKRLKEIEHCNKMQLRAIRSLLAHGLDGNNTSAMTKCAEEIDNYLYDRQ